MTTNKKTEWQSEYSDYLQPVFLQYVDKDSVNTIFELGCRDGNDTLGLRDHFEAQVHAFECNPHMLDRTKAKLGLEPNVHFVPCAVWDSDGVIDFYPVRVALLNNKPINNEGASSCFKARGDYLRNYLQSEVEVESVRLDTYCQHQHIDQIDLLCMDIQGAVLQALIGLGNKLDRVKWIIAEIERKEIYHDEALFPEVDAFLSNNGFVLKAEVFRDEWFSDYLYVKA